MIRILPVNLATVLALRDAARPYGLLNIGSFFLPGFHGTSLTITTSLKLSPS